MSRERLDKILASTGRWSRRDGKILIREGRVLIDGTPARNAEEKVDPEMSAITVDGEDLGYRRYTYLLMNKPAGVLSATEDRRQGTVLDLLPQELRRIGLSPVGRLDKDTEGLLLLTNDGAMAHALLSAPANQGDVAAFSDGVRLDDFTCLPAILEITEDPAQVFVTLHEGKFHQIKRMFLHQGKTVLYLRRVAMGPIQLGDDLQEGEYRHLSEQEVAELNKITQR